MLPLKPEILKNTFRETRRLIFTNAKKIKINIGESAVFKTLHEDLFS